MSKRRELTQYRVRTAFGPDRVSQAAYFVWAYNKEKALELIRRHALNFDVVEARPIGRLIPHDAVDGVLKNVSRGTGVGVPTRDPR
jgi:hypothetical protein